MFSSSCEFIIIYWLFFPSSFSSFLGVRLICKFGFLGYSREFWIKRIIAFFYDLGKYSSFVTVFCQRWFICFCIPCTCSVLSYMYRVVRFIVSAGASFHLFCSSLFSSFFYFFNFVLCVSELALFCLWYFHKLDKKSSRPDCGFRFFSYICIYPSHGSFHVRCIVLHTHTSSIFKYLSEHNNRGSIVIIVCKCDGKKSRMDSERRECRRCWRAYGMLAHSTLLRNVICRNFTIKWSWAYLTDRVID